MATILGRIFILTGIMVIICGCASYQPTKNVWKSTKSLWNTYVSPPATVDYEDKGDLPPHAIALARDMMGVDKQLAALERAMQNADKPPTQEWLDNHFANFSWLSGFAGIKYDGTILGQHPADSLKELDFNRLLYEDKKQNSRALRADIQPSPLGPEIMLATPLYDGVDFLGIVVSYFDMRALMRFSPNPEDIVVLSPTALLWPGKYDFAATPLAGVDWEKIVRESSAGVCANATGSFIYQVRYLANLPLVFAIPEKGDFPTGNGELEQGYAYFPKEREKMPPPPLPERLPQRADTPFGHSEDAEYAGPVEGATPEGQEEGQQTAVAQPRQGSDPNEIQPGSRQSVLLREGKGGSGRQVQERDLEGENVPVERVQRPRRRPQPVIIEPELEPIPEPSGPTLRGGRPSPFGPQQEEAPVFRRPSPFGPAHEETPVEAGGASEAPAQTESPDAQSGSIPAQPAPAAPETSPAPPAAPATPPAAPNTPAVDQVEENEPLADGEVPESRPEEPATLPGGRPSPFGPRR